MGFCFFTTTERFLKIWIISVNYRFLLTLTKSKPLYGLKFILLKKMKSRIHIGTSGWSYKHWRGGFYPSKLAASKWLDFYTEHFSTTEINASFYRLPSQETVMKWTEGVP